MKKRGRRDGYIMEIRIAKQVNPVFECMEILVRHFSGRSYALLKKEVRTRLDIHVPEIEELLDFLQDIFVQITKDIKQNDEILSYLFCPLGNQELTPAEAILQYYGDFSEQDPAKIEAGVLTSFRRNPHAFLFMTLDNYNLLNLSPGKKTSEGCSLLELMEACTLSDQDKWRLVTFYHDFEAYLSRFTAVLSKAIEAFLPFLPSLSVWTDPFYLHFSQNVNEKTL